MTRLHRRLYKTFEADPFPGKPKILFIGSAESSHTHAWIDLLTDAAFNVRLFAVPDGGCPPHAWKVRTYLAAFPYPPKFDRSTRKLLYPQVWRGIKRTAQIFRQQFTHPKPKIPQSTSAAEDWLARIIKTWQPDIIHTMGIYDHQGGLFYYIVRKKFRLESYSQWVVQLRGGSDLTLRRFDPDLAVQIQQILMDCDYIISDNRMNVAYAANMEILPDKFAPLTPIPGSGGIDVNSLAASRVMMPSRRQRVIIWPKAYECPWSKALPVLEAIKLAWSQIQPCEIYMTARSQPDVHMWINALPEEIRRACIVRPRLAQHELLRLMLQARVLLAPSLVDGIPNILYEAMACGTLPIVSPLDTIITIVNHEENVLFARNLYPQEIADALCRAMSDDLLVDEAAQRNLQLVKSLADRVSIQPRVVSYYETLATRNCRIRTASRTE